MLCKVVDDHTVLLCAGRTAVKARKMGFARMLRKYLLMEFLKIDPKINRILTVKWGKYSFGSNAIVNIISITKLTNTEMFLFELKFVRFTSLC